MDYELKKNLILPNDYIPFNEIVFCSNLFINGNVLIQIGNDAILLVGNGEVPLIWLKYPTNHNNWAYIVEKNTPLHKDISIFANNRTTTMIFNLLNTINDNIIKNYNLDIKKTIIKVSKISNKKAIIEELDLRPIGLEIYGNNDGLNVATNYLKNNSFVNVDTMIKIE